MLRDTTKDKQVKQEINHILIFYLTGYQYGQTFPGIFIHDIQYLKGSAIGRTVYHEVIAPDMVLVLRSKPYTRTIIKP